MENNMTNIPTHTALDVANAFIEIAARNGQRLTNMQLQKLVYFAFGYYAGFMNSKLFRDEIQAWGYGPVIPTLYHKLKGYGVGAVTELLPSTNIVGDSSVEKKIIEGVWDSYHNYTALQLSSLTHKDGTPWQHMWEKSKGRKNVPIPFSLIREHYEKLIRERMNAKAN
jgi:uncharacterized phage-associated protein